MKTANDNKIINELRARNRALKLKFDAVEIKALRERIGVDVKTFAKVVAARVKTVKKWEAGITRPKGAALVLLHLINKHGLDYFLVQNETT